MSDHKDKITELAELMEEFRLSEASIQEAEFRIAFRRRVSVKVVATETTESSHNESHGSDEESEPEDKQEPTKGTPITSPMNGIYYASPSPTSAPFVKEGEAIQAGQVVGLIEAMKVFNEINSTISGTVLKLVAETGAVVQPGDVLLYIG